MCTGRGFSQVHHSGVDARTGMARLLLRSKGRSRGGGRLAGGGGEAKAPASRRRSARRGSPGRRSASGASSARRASKPEYACETYAHAGLVACPNARAARVDAVTGRASTKLNLFVVVVKRPHVR